MMRVWLTAALAVLATTGCTDRACFKWENTQGVCPARDGARQFFGLCNDIESIDGEGTLEDGACCYAVTKSTRGFPCQPENFSSGSRSFGSSSFDGSSVGSAVGSGGFGGGTGGFGGTGGVGGGTGGFGGTGAGGGGTGGGPLCDMLAYCGYYTSEGCVLCASEGPCVEVRDLCANDVECFDFYECFDDCLPTDGACLEACVEMFPDGANLFFDFLECAVCEQCSFSCASDPIWTSAACAALQGP